jgi:hypothetical protein
MTAYPTVVVQFKKSPKDCHFEAQDCRAKSAVSLPAASRFLADEAGFGMTRRVFLREMHHDLSHNTGLTLFHSTR